MSKTLQLVLIIGSLLFLVFLIGCSRKLKLKNDYAVIWIILSLLILVLSLFPQIIISVTSILGVESPANGVYLLFTLILLVLSFFLFVKISTLENKVSDLAQKLSIEQSKNKQDSH